LLSCRSRFTSEGSKLPSAFASRRWSAR
jgi:hypothetical protein